MIEPRVVNFGCRLNAFEAEAMAGFASAAGLDDVVIVNTCAVTAEAERQARQAIRKLRRERPSARIVVTGCAAQIDPARFAAMAEVDHVIGNREKLEPATFMALAGAGMARVSVGDIALVRETAGHLIAGFQGRARAFIEVQQGCDHRCTFCIIPFGRGPSRSVPAPEVVARVRALVEGGTAEVVLTGVDITHYGADLPGSPTLGALARRILREVPELPRLRLSSLDPIEIDGDLMAAIGEEPRLMPHLHLSLQAGDDMVLKRMKRRHTSADAVQLCRRVRDLRPDVAFGADIIAGFPTETEAMFRRTLDHIGECGITFLHVFPFSARPGTPAARMPAVNGAVVRERARRLREQGRAARRRFLEARIGETVSVLVEKSESGFAAGHSEHFAFARVAGEAMPGAIVRARVEGADDEGLQARLVDPVRHPSSTIVMPALDAGIQHGAERRAIPGSPGQARR